MSEMLCLLTDASNVLSEHMNDVYAHEIIREIDGEYQINKNFDLNILVLQIY